MNAAIVFFVIGVGVAAVLLANRLVTRDRRPGSRDGDGGTAHGYGSDHGGDARTDDGGGGD